MDKLPGVNMGLRVLFALAAAISTVAGPEAVAKLMVCVSVYVCVCVCVCGVLRLWCLACVVSCVCVGGGCVPMWVGEQGRARLQLGVVLAVGRLVCSCFLS